MADRYLDEQEEWRDSFRRATASLAQEGVKLNERDLAVQERFISGELTFEQFLAVDLQQALETERERQFE
jgi:hypothetical protein